MAQKRFSFFLSGFFWDELLKYWFREDASGETLNERLKLMVRLLKSLLQVTIAGFLEIINMKWLLFYGGVFMCMSFFFKPD